MVRVAPLGRIHDTPGRTTALLFAAFAAMVGFRLFLARDMEVPTLYSDEMGYFANARYLAGRGATLFAPGTPPTYFGYSLLLTPLYWLFDESLEVFRWALHLNAVLASTLVFVLYLLGRRLFDLSRAAAVGVASLASLYPPFLVHSNFAWTENLLPQLFAVWVLLAMACARRPGAVRALAFALVTGYAFATHPRTLPLAFVAAGYLLYLGSRRRMSKLAVVSALALLVATVGGAAALSLFLRQTMWEFGRVMSVTRLTSKASRPELLPEFVLGATGQIWYLLASTLGLAALGVVYLCRHAKRRPGGADPRGHREGAVIALLGMASLFGLSVVYIVGGPRLDQLVYGRYNEIFVPALLVAVLAYLLQEEDRAIDRLFVAGAGVLALAPIVTWVRMSDAYGGPPTWLVVFGVLPFQSSTTTIEFPIISMASAGCALALCLLLKWRLRLGLVLLGLAGLAGAHRIERGWIVPLSSGFPLSFTLHEVIDTLPAEEAVALDTDTAKRINVNAYQFHLIDRRTFLFSSTEEDPPADVVVASTEWPAAARVGATLVAAEHGNDHGLWVMPGPLLESLRGREFRRRWEAEELQTEIKGRFLRRSRAKDARASDGLARRGWPAALPPERQSFALVFGPYTTLIPGRYEVLFRLALDEGAEAAAVDLDVSATSGSRVLASTRVAAAERGQGDAAQYHTVRLTVETDVAISGVEFRVFYRGGGEVKVDYVETEMRLAEPSSAPAPGA